MKSVNSLEIPTSLADIATPERMGLLVYDMQVGICSQVESKEVKTAVRTMLAAARAAGLRIAYTRHLSLPKAWMGVTQYRTAMAWQRKAEPVEVSPWFLRDTSGFQIVPELAPTADDAVFDKLAMSAFEGTPLHFALSDAGIRALAIVGIAMEVGIEPTARNAADLGIIPVIVEDAVGWGNKEAADRSIAGLRYAGDSLFTTVAELTDLWSSATARSEGRRI
jgi:nicotinamidase-related amidase